MSRKTSYDELYTTIGAVILAATGRPWWRKAGIQSRPNGPYATLFITEGAGIELPVVESVEILPATPDEVFTQIPWGTQYLDIKVEFLKTNRAGNDSAMQAATRFSQALRLQERFFDVWEICGMVQGIRTQDISAMFREDTEPRADVKFTVIANIAEPGPLADDEIYDMQHETVNVEHVSVDSTITGIPVTVNK